jgi:hypothetical protein
MQFIDGQMTSFQFLEKKLLNKMQQKLALGDPFQFLGKRKPQATHTHCFSTGEGLC